LIDGLGAGGEPALQQGQGEADGVLALAVQMVRAVHLVADIVGDGRVQGVFQSREGVVDRVGAAFREEAGIVEFRAPGVSSVEEENRHPGEQGRPKRMHIRK
jgi:hypothetical protein